MVFRIETRRCFAYYVEADDIGAAVTKFKAHDEADRARFLEEEGEERGRQTISSIVELTNAAVIA